MCKLWLRRICDFRIGLLQRSLTNKNIKITQTITIKTTKTDDELNLCIVVPVTDDYLLPAKSNTHCIGNTLVAVNIMLFLHSILG